MSKKKKLKIKAIFLGMTMLFFCFSCENRIFSDKLVTGNNKNIENDYLLKSKKESDLLDAVSIVGDTNAYNELCILYVDARPDKILFPSLVMANKYKFKRAFYEVFASLSYSFNQEITKISKKEMGDGNYEMAMYHLKKGAEINEVQCKQIWEKYYK